MRRLLGTACRHNDRPVVGLQNSNPALELMGMVLPRFCRDPHLEVGAFYWTDWAPDIVNPRREEQGLVSL